MEIIPFLTAQFRGKIEILSIRSLRLFIYLCVC